MHSKYDNYVQAKKHVLEEQKDGCDGKQKQDKSNNPFSSSFKPYCTLT